MGEDILKKKAKPVRNFDSVLHTLIDDMWDTLKENDGLGLAAPQIGVLRRIIVIELEEDHFELINPELLETTGMEVKSEACLSVPNKQGDVERPVWIRVGAVDRHGEYYEVETDDEMLATAICHEMDHLEGILFLDKAVNIQERPDEEVVKARHKQRNRGKRKKKHFKIKFGKEAV